MYEPLKLFTHLSEIPLTHAYFVMANLGLGALRTGRAGGTGLESF